MSIKEAEKFSTQVDTKVLAHLRELAGAEGRQVQALVDEALRDLLEKRRNQRPRDRVMSAYFESHASYQSLYEKLAK